MPSDRPIDDPPLARPGQEVRAPDERRALRIPFPKVDGYRVEVPEERIELDPPSARGPPLDPESGRAAGRERGWSEGLVSVGGGSYKKKQETYKQLPT